MRHDGRAVPLCLPDAAKRSVGISINLADRATSEAALGDLDIALREQPIRTISYVEFKADASELDGGRERKKWPSQGGKPQADV